jgi:hypothetical protein
LIATHSKLKLYKNIEAVIDRGDVLRLKSGFRFYIEAFISQTCAGLFMLTGGVRLRGDKNPQELI